MNGEILQMTKMALIAKHFIKTGTMLDCLDYKGIKRIRFQGKKKYFNFLPGPAFIKSLEKWLLFLAAKRTARIFLILTDEVMDFRDFSLSTTFVNGNPFRRIAALSENGFSMWRQHCRLLSWEKWQWEIIYYEQELPGQELLIVEGEDVIKSLRLTLRELEVFALEIKGRFWAEQFKNAYRLIEGQPMEPKYPLNLEGLLEPEKIGIMNGLNYAWVFGGMGSWNDSPGAIEDKHLADYERLSLKLYRDIMRALMDCVNEPG